MFYKVGLEIKDGTILEAIVESDNKTSARAKALQNAKKIVKGQKEESNAFYGKRDYRICRVYSILWVFEFLCIAD